MAGLIPFNRRNNDLARKNIGFEDFHNMLDDFFSGESLFGRSLIRDTFKIDIEETDKEYRVEAELPGVKKEEIDLGVEDDNLCISVKRSEETNADGKNYIHRERRASSMLRRIRLANAKLDSIKAKLEEGILTVSVPKDEKTGGIRKINIE
ncbi:MAG: Hsp20/alpha crystallin family protein [Clostridiales bacterium]|nr:Hsp20/alpha crystallin family protein [Clostridiales bacterium]